MLGPSLRMSPHRSLSLNTSIYICQLTACIGPLFQVASYGNASATKPAILSPRSSIASLSPCWSLNNFLTASMTMRSLVYSQTRVDFSTVQVRVGFSLYSPPIYLDTGLTTALYANRTISWSDKPYMTCFFCTLAD